jgi:hypothetical protein
MSASVKQSGMPKVALSALDPKMPNRSLPVVVDEPVNQVAAAPASLADLDRGAEPTLEEDTVRAQALTSY